jgi:ATP phosphoribosyltransferase regulatory subunit
MDLSHIGIIQKAIDAQAQAESDKAYLAKNLSRKNIPGLLKRPGITQNSPIVRLAGLYGEYEEVKAGLAELCGELDAGSELDELCSLSAACADLSVRIDFSVGNGLNYYSGLVFEGFIEGEAQAALSGGRYDRLLRNFGYADSFSAAGFAVYLDKIRRLSEE